jgi:hypothetical protein
MVHRGVKNSPRLMGDARHAGGTDRATVSGSAQHPHAQEEYRCAKRRLLHGICGAADVRICDARRRCPSPNCETTKHGDAGAPPAWRPCALPPPPRLPLSSLWPIFSLPLWTRLPARTPARTAAAADGRMIAPSCPATTPTLGLQGTAPSALAAAAPQTKGGRRGKLAGSSWGISRCVPEFRNWAGIRVLGPERRAPSPSSACSRRPYSLRQARMERR